MTQMRNGVNDICGNYKFKSDDANASSKFKNGVKRYTKNQVARKMSQMRHRNLNDGKMIYIGRFLFK